MSESVRIALDVMGGDHAPKAIIDGAIEAASLIKGSILMVGNLDQIKPLLPQPLPSNISLHPASQVVEMDEKPLEAYKKKKDSSMMVAARLVKDGQADAFVSAGNTGAASSTALLTWRQMDGIHRPAICSQMPNYYDGFALLDAGASPDVDPSGLVEFAIMGRAYAQKVMGRENPRVHLLNIGEEEGKGNAFSKAAFNLLQKYEWFAGNIEGKEMYASPCDVVVCDGFVGNVVLKTSEGVAEVILRMIKESVPTSLLGRIPYLPMASVMRPIRNRLDYAETGGSPLLGLNELCIICHGRSDSRAIKNALIQTERAVKNGLISAIRLAIKQEIGS